MQGQAEQIIGFMEKNRRATLPIIVGKCDLIESRLECARIMHHLSDLKVIKKENDEYVFLKRLAAEIPDIDNKRKDIFRSKISVNKSPIRLVQPRAKKIDFDKNIKLRNVNKEIIVSETKVTDKNCGLIRNSVAGKIALYLFNANKRTRAIYICQGINEKYSVVYASIQRLLGLGFIKQTTHSTRNVEYEFNFEYAYPFATKAEIEYDDSAHISKKIIATSPESIEDIKRIAISILEKEMHEHQQTVLRVRSRISQIKDNIKSLSKIK